MITPAIRAIDKLIAANEAALIKAFGRPPMGASQWQKAWDAHPALQDRARDLWRQRGVAQIDRDQQAAKLSRRAVRVKPPRKCPTCGCRTLTSAEVA